MLHLIVYRPHGALMLDTKYIGPFHDHHSAYDYFCDKVPPLGPRTAEMEAGVRYIIEMELPQ